MTRKPSYTEKIQANTDFLIMKLRTLATLRGANPVEIQRNVEALETYEFPENVRVGLRDQYIDDIR